MGKERIFARALARQERAQVKAAIKAGDELGYNRNYTRGLVKFGQEGMTPEARMARAREMGFQGPLFHGTATDFQAFDPRKAGGVTKAQSARLGTWLTNDPKTAAGYGEIASSKPVQDLIDASYAAERRGQWDKANELMAQAERLEQGGGAGGQNILPLMARGNMKTVDMDGVKYDPEDVDLSGMVKDARSEGFDSLRLSNFSDEAEWGQYNPADHVMISNPSNIRSPFATFDPARANRRDLLAGVVPVAAAGGAGALAMQPQEAEAAQPVASPALARALAREAPRFNAAVDTSLDVASFFDPTMGYATETARALKDLPAKVGPAGAVALAPLTGATEALGSIGQLPEMGVAGGRALARAIARKPAPRGSGTYRKAK